MVKVRILLGPVGDRWKVTDTFINYDDQEVEQLGPIEAAVEYEEAIKEAKRWVMLKLKHRHRRETEEQVGWTIEPALPVRHLAKL
ncbi:hypothetical protein [Candidatus Nitrospira bockiana]